MCEGENKSTPERCGEADAGGGSTPDIPLPGETARGCAHGCVTMRALGLPGSLLPSQKPPDATFLLLALSWLYFSILAKAVATVTWVFSSYVFEN